MPKTVLITGASRGLGLSLTQTFLRAGWQVIGVSRTRSHWKKMRAALPAKAALTLYAVDLTAEAPVRTLARRIGKKPIDLLINNAGYGGRLSRVEKTAVADYRRILDGNLLSAFLMCKYFVPIVRRRERGLIMNVSSMAGQRAVPRLALYSAAKFGVIALSQAVAKENQEHGFRCITVCPGGMNTEMRASLFGAEDAARQQSTDFVADIMRQITEDKISVESGGDIVIRHGAISAIHPCPGA